MDLLPHNQKAYNSIIAAFKHSHYTCVIHPTGSGKSYIALQLIEDHPGSRILYVTSYAMNLVEFQSKVEEHILPVVGSSIDLTYSIYANLVPDAYEPFDYIILDEFHRAGAKEWSKLVQLLEVNNPQAYYLGLSATPIRYLDSMRDMSVELFDGNVASNISLKDAIKSKILPVPKTSLSVCGSKVFERSTGKASWMRIRSRDWKRWISCGIRMLRRLTVAG